MAMFIFYHIFYIINIKQIKYEEFIHLFHTQLISTNVYYMMIYNSINVMNEEISPYSSIFHSVPIELDYFYLFLFIVYNTVLFWVFLHSAWANNFHSFFNLKDCCLMFWTHGNSSIILFFSIILHITCDNTHTR